MTQHTLGILIGGLVPALMYGVFPVFVKYSNQHQLSPGALLVCIGVAVAALGTAFMLLFEQGFQGLRWSGVGFGLLSGLVWGLGALGVTYAIAHLDAPVALITPLFNTNTLVAVLLGLVLFAEWKTLEVPWLVGGTLLIVAGGIVISRA